ncbi:uncharacterized protein LOC129731045 [Wyeomyia smithii]|uniref:uncharacterized protein LOC129731045 n=1 Tax=Wyeomyia smithii TaxID=174621 RepID=UPI0024680D82|nr:uncharacterized protein LOC129731045 [Wyeomyia smithii]
MVRKIDTLKVISSTVDVNTKPVGTAGQHIVVYFRKPELVRKILTMLMVDSGNESADRLESLFLDKRPNHSESDAESDVYSKANQLEVVFQDPKDNDLRKMDLAPISDRVRASDRRVLTSDNSTESYTSSVATSSVSTQDDETRTNQKVTQINTCKILQRKLELKVERAKRNYRQMYEEEGINHDNQVPKTATLIPITRLAIPGGTVRDNEQPLVDVEPTAAGSEEDELEAVTFFPRASRKSLGQHKRQELSDTFSIQEMTIESEQEDELDFEQCRKLSNSKGYKKILNRGLSADGDYLDNENGDFEDEDDDDSQNLELLPPKTGYGLRELAQRAICCFRKNDLLS